MKEFVKEVKAHKKSIEKIHAKVTNQWMNGDFSEQMNVRFGRSLDYLIKASEQLDKLLPPF